MDGYILAESELGCMYHDDCFTCPFDDCRWYINARKKKAPVKHYRKRKGVDVDVMYRILDRLIEKAEGKNEQD